MKASLPSVLLTVLTGAAVGLLVSTLELQPAAREGAQLGTWVSTAAGLVAILWKARVAAQPLVGTGSLRAAFTVQVLVLGLRAAVVFAGALAMRPRGEEALVGFVLAFFATYLLQQFVEVRLFLSARAAPPVSR
jgi:hypothetical protein